MGGSRRPARAGTTGPGRKRLRPRLPGRTGSQGRRWGTGAGTPSAPRLPSARSRRCRRSPCARETEAGGEGVPPPGTPGWPHTGSPSPAAAAGAWCGCHTLPAPPETTGGGIPAGTGSTPWWGDWARPAGGHPPAPGTARPGTWGTWASWWGSSPTRPIACRPGPGVPSGGGWGGGGDPPRPGRDPGQLPRSMAARRRHLPQASCRLLRVWVISGLCYKYEQRRSGGGKENEGREGRVRA